MTLLTREQVIEEFCKLSSEVMEHKFDCTRAADCFCGDKGEVDPTNYRFDSEVVDYIKGVVLESLTAKRGFKL